jgi:hypothetical protein
MIRIWPYRPLSRACVAALALAAIMTTAACRGPLRQSAHASHDAPTKAATSPTSPPAARAPDDSVSGRLAATSADEVRRALAGGIGAIGPEIVAISGWFVALALVVLLLRLNQQWRTSFRNREWLLVPSAEGQTYLWGLHKLTESIADERATVERALLTLTTAVSADVQASDTSRREFSVLREELERRATELEAARTGVDLWHRRAVLRAVTRAAEMIREDRERQRDVQSTLDGLCVELQECLEENRISVHFPAIGAPLAGDATVDPVRVVREPTTEDHLRGTISAVESPAYVALRTDGKQDVLLPARVRVFV